MHNALFVNLLIWNWNILFLLHSMLLDSGAGQAIEHSVNKYGLVSKPRLIKGLTSLVRLIRSYSLEVSPNPHKIEQWDITCC